MKNLAAISVLFMLSLSACALFPSGGGISTPIEMTAVVGTVLPEGSGTDSPFLTPGPPTKIPALAEGLSPTELKYRVLEEFPDFFFCDPDYYPIAREDEMVLARERFPELQADQEEFQAILTHIGLSGSTAFTEEQKLLIYREHKKLNAIFFLLVEDKYQFQIQTGLEGQEGTVITATIAGDGSIGVLQREPGFPACPICLAAGTLIDTPRGAVPVEELRVGDPVWTKDETGRRVSAPLVRVGSMRAPVSHPMVHLILNDGRELLASAGHPTADRRTLAELGTGSLLDGARIVQLEQVTYDSGYTFDVLPSGGTGWYWANGILMGSTLTQP